MAKQYQFDEAKCRELFHTHYMDEVAHEIKVTVHISKTDETYWNGIPVFHKGQWDMDNLAIVNNYVNPEPVLVKFGAISSLQCSKEL